MSTPHHHLPQALARWPDFGVEHVFVARLNGGVVEPAAPEEFVPEDFYLACAALKGVPGAVRELERLLSLQFRSLHHFRLADAEVDDLRAALFAALLVGEEEARPRLERYLGRGALAGWLRVTAAREVVSWLRRHRRVHAAGDEALVASLESPGEAPELLALKERYRGEFSAAFRRAISGLEVRDRNLLRQHYLDELTLEELAALYRVHRATVARWLSAARVTLLERTRGELCGALGVGRAEVDSLMRLLRSQLDLSIGVFLAGEEARASR